MISVSELRAQPDIHLRNNIQYALLGEDFQKNANVMKYELCP